MKKSSLRNLGVMAVVLCLVTTCLLGGTLARYTTEVSAKAKTTVAAWSFKAMNGDTALTNASVINLATTTYDETTLKTGMIAPGTKGTFDLKIDGTGSDVGISYSIKISKANTGSIEIPTNLKFQIDGKDYTLNELEQGTIAANAENKVITLPVTWEWPYGANVADNVDGAAFDGGDLVLDIVVTGEQVTPAEPSVP